MCIRVLMPSIRSRLQVAPLLAVAALVNACSEPAGLEPIAGTAFVQGPVASITPGQNGSVLLVRAGPTSREPCGIAATISTRTRVLRRSTTSGALRRADLRELRVGDTVEVYVDEVADSCPAQGTPTALVLR
jgi:hypothetical protein